MVCGTAALSYNRYLLRVTSYRVTRVVCMYAPVVVYDMSPLRTLIFSVTQYGCHEGHSTTNHLEYNTLLPSPRGRVRALTATTTGNNSSKYTGKNRGAQLARRQNWTRDANTSAQKQFCWSSANLISTEANRKSRSHS